jgi:hypothetical protein
MAVVVRTVAVVLRTAAAEIATVAALLRIVADMIRTMGAAHITLVTYMDSGKIQKMKDFTKRPALSPIERKAT